MGNIEIGFILLSFFLIESVVGYITFLIFRISVHQGKFSWAGALSVTTILAGGGFLTYLSEPRNFAAYGIGFFIGFVAYFRLLQDSARNIGSDAPVVTGSRAVPLTLGSQAVNHSNIEDETSFNRMRLIGAW